MTTKKFKNAPHPLPIHYFFFPPQLIKSGAVSPTFGNPELNDKNLKLYVESKFTKLNIYSVNFKLKPTMCKTH